MKVGVFALAFNDLTVGAQGLPIQVQRTYDSRDKTVGDFGVGWHLGAANVRVEKSVSLGKYWYQFQDTSGFDTYYLYPLRDPVVTVTFPSGKVYQFQLQVSPSSSFAYPFNGQGVDPIYQPVNGTVGSLFATMGSEIMVPEDAQYNVPFQLMDLDGNIYNPTTFTLTDENGIQYTVDQTAGIQQITDLNGNTLYFSPAGITSSCGRGITIVRDSNNRITSITDAAGNVSRYTYDAAGDLATYTDRTGNQQSFSYDDQHNMLTAMDGNGNIPANYGYDASGRLTGVTDAYGNQTSFTHDLATNTDIVTDALGHTTTYQYDDDGNVVRKVDANGKVWLSTFDANDNQLSATDPLGNTSYMEYDSVNNKTADVDALGNRTTYTWIINRKMTSKTDPLGRVTSWTYNAQLSGVQSQTNPIATEVTTYGYDGAGNLTSKTDPLGNVTTYAPDGFGHNGAVTDPMGHTVSYTYDSNGNQLTKSETRTKADGTLELLLTTWTYDDGGRVLSTVFPDGSTTSSSYDRAGNVLTKTDQLSRVTTYKYDQLERLIETDYPDGYSECISYDAVGRKSTTTDKAGRITTFGYDPTGRLVQATYPDSSTSRTGYDDAGRVTTQTNENGHTLAFAHDASGQLVSITDPAGNVSSMSYDDAGQALGVVDPLGHAKGLAYDADGRLIRTTYADASHDDVGYDKNGNRVSATDQAGVETTFAYDADDRVVSLVDAAHGTTAYQYDEVGSRIAQTDAKAHTTKYVYDSMGRMVNRVLPLSQYESLQYDSLGRLLSKTDFNLHTTMYSYDSGDRVLTKTPDVSFTSESPVRWSYSPTGQRLTMSDGTGVTTYTYDSRDRLLSKATAEGTLTYTRDGAGHVLTTRSEVSGGVAVDYAWDNDERLLTVASHGPGAPVSGDVTTYQRDIAGRVTGWAQPNGVTTRLTYDVVNRLVGETVANATPHTLNTYAYTLDPAGHRLGVVEGSGRTVTWSYDPLYRLTGETIAGAASANGSVTYQYDSVGNRLARTSSLPGVPSQSKSFDANDQVVGEVFDSNGDQRTRDGGSQSFDSQDRLISSTTAAMTSTHVYYDGDGTRVAEESGAGLVTYLVDDQTPTRSSQVVEERVAGAVVGAYTFGLTPLAHRMLGAGVWQSSYYESDGHGSVAALTDTNGNITDTYEYDAFGAVVARTGATSNPLTYGGEWTDDNQSMQFLRGRWYAFGSGSFVSRDPHEVWGRDSSSCGSCSTGHCGCVPTPDPMQRAKKWTKRITAGGSVLLSSYVYASDDPVNRADPSGCDDIGSVVAVADIGASLAFSASPSFASYGLDQNVLALGSLVGGGSGGSGGITPALFDWPTITKKDITFALAFATCLGGCGYVFAGNAPAQGACIIVCGLAVYFYLHDPKEDH